MNKETDAPDIMTVPAGQEIHPKGFLDAIAFVESSFAFELQGATIPGMLLTTKQRIEFFEVGFRSAFLSGLVTALLTPLAIGVIERYVTVFGTTNPTPFDMFFAFMLAVGYSLGFGIFLAHACTKFIGNYTKSIIKNLLGGVVSGAILKMMLAFVGFHFIYFIVLSDAHLQWIGIHLYKLHLPEASVIAIYNWIHNFRPVFLISAWFIVGVTLVFISIPTIAMLLAARRNKKLIKAGFVKDPAINR